MHKEGILRWRSSKELSSVEDSKGGAHDVHVALSTQRGWKGTEVYLGSPEIWAGKHRGPDDNSCTNLWRFFRGRNDCLLVIVCNTSPYRPPTQTSTTNTAIYPSCWIVHLGLHKMIIPASPNIIKQPFCCYYICRCAFPNSFVTFWHLDELRGK